MGGDARLNLLLTHEEPRPFTPQDQPWYRTLSHMLAPLGVRTFEATSGSQAVEVIERHPIHVAVVDSRLPAISGLNILQLVQKLREKNTAEPSGHPPAGANIRVQMHVEERTGDKVTQRRIDVQVNARPVAFTPTVILITPPNHDDKLLHEALKFNAFSVLSEPVDVNLMLDLMARALRKFHQNQWPQ